MYIFYIFLYISEGKFTIYSCCGTGKKNIFCRPTIDWGRRLFWRKLGGGDFFENKHIGGGRLLFELKRRDKDFLSTIKREEKTFFDYKKGARLFSDNFPQNPA